MDQHVKQSIRTLVNTFYMVQKLRIQTGNRICRNFAAQIGQEEGMAQDELSSEAQKLLLTLKDEHKLLASALVKTIGDRQLPILVTSKKGQLVFNEHRGILSEPYEFVMIDSYVDLERTEERLGREIAAMVQEHPLWDGFLKGVKGIGPILAAVIIAELDPTKPYPSNFWSYAGLDVAEDGRGRSRRAEHLVTYQYTNKKGEPAERQGITFNMFLKTKLIGVAGPCLLRAGGSYGEVYRKYKHRLENHAKYGIAAEERLHTLEAELVRLKTQEQAMMKSGQQSLAQMLTAQIDALVPEIAELKSYGLTKLHRHNMAVRYMVKIFLLDLHIRWREIEGLPASVSYQEAKLGHVHGQAYNQQIDQQE